MDDNLEKIAPRPGLPVASAAWGTAMTTARLPHRRAPATSAPFASRSPLAIVFLVVEAVTAFLTDSLALLSDAAHLLTDAVGIGMALAAIGLAGRARLDGARTFGLYRLEILAALANALLLFGVTIYILVEAVQRVGEDPDVQSGPMLVVAIVGLAVNVVSVLLLRSGSAESLNVRVPTSRWCRTRSPRRG